MNPPTFVSEAVAPAVPLVWLFSLPPAMPDEDPRPHGLLLTTPLATVPPTLVCCALVFVDEPPGPAVPLALLFTEVELPDTAPTLTPPLPAVLTPAWVP